MRIATAQASVVEAPASQARRAARVDPVAALRED